MFCQFNVSPARHPKPRKVQKREEPEVNILSLAPFTPNPKICFENIKVGENATRQLHITNPAENGVELHLTRTPPVERNVKFNWHTHFVPAHAEKVLEISWTPTCDGGWRDTITLEDHRKIKRDIPLIFKSCSPKINKKVSKTTAPKRTFLATKRASPVKRIKSPLTKFKSPEHKNFRKPTLPSNMNISLLCIQSPWEENMYSTANKENYAPDTSLMNDSVFVSPTSVSFNSNRVLCDHNYRRETYTIKGRVIEEEQDKFNDSLEITSPERKCTNINVSPERNIHMKLDATSFLFTPQVNLNSTYDVKGEDIQNISGGTYVKGNLSSSTYTKANLSASTYTKHNSEFDGRNSSLSSEIYSPIERPSAIFARHELSGENVRKVIEADLWKTDGSYVGNQTENDLGINNSTSKGFKRKSTTLVNSIPNKRVNYDKNVLSSGGWAKKPFVPPRKVRKTVLFKSQREDFNECSLVSTKTSIVTCDPFTLAAIDSIDPFMTGDLYFSTEWLEKQIKHFENWLNVLLTPPSELSTDDVALVDVGKVWQECNRREVALAPTKEAVSNKYHTNKRLDALRIAARKLYRSKEVCEVLKKTLAVVDSGKVAVRNDKDVHLDLGIQSEVMCLFLCYNPLWLRIGLETIYNCIIPLHSNSDIVGLSHFIIKHFFKDAYLLKKFKSVHSPKYCVEIKKFILKKFLVLVYFLDQAKTKKLIAHDPCLFSKKASIKQSREILHRFSSILLSAIDLTKYLRCAAYTVTHQQTYIHEYDYAVNNLGLDLRDGVRLAKVTEIILLQDNITTELRAPAVSRLQKIHNVKLSFIELQKAGFQIQYDIEPKDIADGHKEKTLSLLWQIVYKFQAPRLTKATTTIQMWWRSCPIVAKRKKLTEIRFRNEVAALKIQRWYKNIKFLQKLEQIIPLVKNMIILRKHNIAATKIQSYYKMYRQKRKYESVRKSAILIQQYFRRSTFIQKRSWAALTIQRFFKAYLTRRKFLKLKCAVATVENQYIAHKMMITQRNSYRNIKASAVIIQKWYRSYKCMKIQYNHFQTIKHSTLCIQKWYKSVQQRKQFLKLRWAANVIQNKYRATLFMAVERKNYLQLKNAIIFVQQKFRAKILFRKAFGEYQLLKHSTLCIQKRFRAKRLMEVEVIRYKALKTASIKLQRWWHALKEMQRVRNYYMRLRQAAIFVQRKYRANKLMHQERDSYISLRQYAILIQTRFRANMLMKREHIYYLNLRNKVVFIQRQYRALKLMKEAKCNYELLRKCVITVQRKFRAHNEMRLRRGEYLLLKKQVIIVQRRFRANHMMKVQRQNYLQIKRSILTLQHRYRGYIQMKICQHNYQIMKQIVTKIQMRFRAKVLMRIERGKFILLKKSTIAVQRRFRANMLMQIERNNYISLRRAAMYVQQRYRALKLGRHVQSQYQSLKCHVIKIQRKYRAHKLMLAERISYLKTKQVAVIIQRRFRANQAMKICRNDYQCLKNAVLVVQQRYRARKLGIMAKQNYQTLKCTTIYVQQRFRANKLMKIERQNYIALKESAIKIQRRIRANNLCKVARNNFLALRDAAIVVQQKYTAKKIGKMVQYEYKLLRTTVIFVQRQFRANKLAYIERNRYNRIRNAATVLQRHFRAYRAMKVERNYYLSLRNSVVFVQKHYRAIRLMKPLRKEYLALKKAVIYIQKLYRAKKQMQLEQQNFVTLRHYVIFIQNRFRANVLRRKEQNNYRLLRHYAIYVQKVFRANVLMRTERDYYICLKKYAIYIQQKWRGNKAMKMDYDKYQQFKKSAITIQKHYRSTQIMRNQQRQYQQLRNKVILIQNAFRAKKLVERCRQDYVNLKRSTLIIQKYWRAHKLMVIERTKYQTQRQAAVVIQRYYRSVSIMKIERHQYLRLKYYVVVIQHRFRANLAMRVDYLQYQNLKRAVCIIENQYIAQRKMWAQRQMYLVIHKSAIKIQRYYRAYRNMKQQRNQFLLMKNAVTVIQKHYRSYRIMKVERHIYLVKLNTIKEIKRYIKGYLVRQKYREDLKPENLIKRRRIRMETKAVIKIQSAWRGHHVRSREIPAIAQIRKRCTVAALNAVPQKTLGHLRDQALQTLTSDNPSLSQIIAALQDIEFITRRCKDTCLQMSETLSEHMYMMISAAGRSLPEMNVCIHATSTLINFCKYKPAISNCWLPEYLDNIFTLMINWCDKEGLLFPYLCTLIWLFAHVEEYKATIVAIPNLKQKMDRIKSLTMRKCKMVSRTNKLLGNSVFMLCSNLRLPSTKPDWGMDYPERPRTFSYSVHAFNSLSEILNI